jgi:hypothetical protein
MSSSTNSTEAVEGVGVEHIKRVFVLLRDKLPIVLTANRFFEEQTGFHNEAGTNNLVDALSHLATLVEHAAELDDTQQAEQVAHLEDHLRRSMMESFEQVLKFRLGEIAELWEEYIRAGQPSVVYRAGTGEISAPSITELEEWRREIRGLLDRGRESKRAITWEEWEQGTEALVQACIVSDKLITALEYAVTPIRRADKWRFYAITGASAVTTLGIGIVVGHWIF